MKDNQELESLNNFLNNSYNNDIKYDKEEFIECIEEIIKSKIGSNLDEILLKLDGRHKRDKGMKQYNKLLQLLDLPYTIGSKRFKTDGKLQTKWIIIKAI